MAKHYTFTGILSRLFNKVFGRWLLLLSKAELSYAKDNLYTFNKAPFLDSQEFKKAYAKGIETDRDRFLKNVDLEWRVHVHAWAAKQALTLEGDFLECGVRTGIFSTAIIELFDLVNQDRQFVLIDSFKGVLPEQLSADEYERERHGVMNEEVWNKIYQEVKERWQAHKHIKVVKGVIPEVLDRVDLAKLAYVSIDLNSALPEKAVLEYIWPKLVPGGIIILDDYGYPGFEEQQQVHDAFAKKVGTSVLCLPTCQGIIIKPNKQ